MMTFVLASDSALAGHPDKLCDRIADALVDACLTAGPTVVNAECAVASGVVFLALRHAGPMPVDPAAVARRVIAASGFGDDALPAERTTVLVDAARDDAMARGAGDGEAGGMATVFGYACNHGAERLPAPIATAHALARAIDAARAAGPLGWLSPDGQVQAAVECVRRRPTRLRGVALRLAPLPGAPPPAEAEAALRAAAIAPALAPLWPEAAEAPPLSVAFVAAPRGPRGHAGLTGRKTADDGYGGFCRQGTSALSGKDPGRVERAAACAARQAAVTVVAAELAEECEVQLCYAPDSAAPISVEVDCFGSATVPEAEIAERVRRGFDFRAGAIVERLGLRSLPAARGGVFYAGLAAYGQMGRLDLDPPWERPDLAALG
jgi:S-adenosylmethionine synthetase